MCCTIPHCSLTVTGASTRWTLLSSTRISLARRHRAFTSPSRRYSHRLSRSICSSREELHTAAVVAATGAAGADWAEAEVEAETEGAPTDAVAAGVGGATAADAILSCWFYERLVGHRRGRWMRNEASLPCQK